MIDVSSECHRPENPFHSTNLAATIKALANEDTLLRTHCCRHKCFPFPRARNICCGPKFCVRDTKNVSDFVQKHSFSQFAQPKKHHGQQCVRNNVSSFTRAFMFRFIFVFSPLHLCPPCQAYDKYFKFVVEAQ